MKNKSIILAALSSLVLLGGATSCEDMLKTESKMVMYDNQNTLNHVNDTVYSVLGVIQKLQTIADRTVILGELRGDLVKTAERSTADLRAINDYDFSENNKYNSPVDYFAVINNCNYYLANVDTNYQRNSSNKLFMKEYSVMESYRAWTYLQLAQVYGTVPYIETPIVSGDQADLSKYPAMDIKAIAEKLIPRLLPLVNLQLPDYGSIGQSDSRYFFIPTRILLGDCYLWAGQYEEAAKCYFNHITKLNYTIPIGTNRVGWSKNDFTSDHRTDSYVGSFSKLSSLADVAIPMETEDYNGIVSDLENIFCSTLDNDYYFQVTYSTALSNLSKSQIFCYNELRSDGSGRYSVSYPNKSDFSDPWDSGDLRLKSILSLETVDNRETAMYSSDRQELEKLIRNSVRIYSKEVVYLRFAEALNRAGLPETAFAALKYGLCNQTIGTVSTYISQAEKDKLREMNISFNENDFKLVEIGTSASITDGNTMGIHSRGSGDSRQNVYYVFPDTTFADYATYTDDAKMDYKMTKVEEMILDEMALETCFEGYRFGDIMRISMHRAKDGKYADNEFFASKVAGRDGSINESLKTKLIGANDDKLNSAWFLPGLY